jgi:hypothetical protein
MTTYVINDIDGDAVQQVASGTIDQIATLYPADHPVLALIGQAAANGTATATYEIDGEQYTTTVVATTEATKLVKCRDKYSGEEFFITGDDPQAEIEHYIAEGIDQDSGSIGYDVDTEDGRNFCGEVG